MAKENLTDDQKKAADENEKTCTESLAQKAQQEAAEQMKKAKEELDKAQQALSDIPEKVIGGLTNAIDKLMSIVNGHVNVNDMSFDPKKVIAQLEALLNPVLSSLGSLPVPAIPGLAQLADLLKALNSMLAPSPDSSGNEPPSVEIPPELMTTLNNLLSTLLTICYTLPLILINLIFQMLNVIIKLFKQIAGVIGVPSIPFPLNLVPKCISMMPDIMSFMLEAPGKMFDVSYASLKKAYGKITSLQVPQPPDNIEKPEQLPTCQKHSSQETFDDESNEGDEEDLYDSEDQYVEA